mmetsp:Transcript_5348/g.7484  ORF Transcript_5348/g.7484 Transcript_5348/m.7484 type:complete len:191 (+) Transcript_5348:168-740(+)
MSASNQQRPGPPGESKLKRFVSKRFSSVDWGKSFRNLSSQRQLQPKQQRGVRFDDADEYDEDITEGNKMSSCCLVCKLTLLAIAVAAAVSLIAFPSNTATLYWKEAMSGINNNSVVQQQLLQQQQGREQEMLELAERINVACGDLSTSSCLKLCSQHMCCVEEDDEYSCKSDVTKDCPVYAGCVVLIDDE